MTTLELKGTLHEMLASVTDREILLKLKDAFVGVIEPEKREVDGWNDLPPDVQVKLNKAYDGFENGKNGIPHEEVMKQAKARMKNFPK